MHQYIIAILLFVANLVSSQFVLNPQTLSVDVGYFSLLPNGTAASCVVTEASSATEAMTLQTSTTCSTVVSSAWTVLIGTEEPRVYVTLANSPSVRMLSILVVCCMDSQSQVSSSIVYVDVSPRMEINASQTAAVGAIYPNPGFVNIAPCPCDLTENMCDINCCCDAECANITATFSCIPGPFGGNFALDIIENCGSQHYPLPDWHMFLCVQFVSTPALGLFYPIDTNIVRSETEFNARLLGNTNTYTFYDGIGDVNLMDVTQYTNGDPVIIKETSTNTFEYLTIRQRTASGQCADDAIVGFQVDTDADCDVTVSTALCTSGTILDVESYLQAANTIDGGETDINPTVEYLCGEASNYVRTAPSSTINGPSSFGTPTAVADPPACPSPPGPPTQSDQTCDNSVVSVTYTMTWDAANITNVMATIIVVNAPLIMNGTPVDTILSQSFRVRYEHATSVSPSTLSGNPGYNFDYPVISGNVTGGVATRNDELRIWQPGGSGLCTESNLVAPPFGRDTISGCQLRLDPTEFGDCAILRQMIETQQILLVGSAQYVSRFGNPRNTRVDSDWLAINQSNISVPFESTTFISGVCDGIPSHVHTDILYTVSGRIYGFPIREIVGVVSSWSRDIWRLQCWNTQACLAVTNTTENFFVTSSVSFIEIPPAGVPTLTLSQMLDNSTCERSAICWPELWLPLTRAFYYTMPLDVARLEVEGNLVWALTLVWFASGFFLLSLDWMKISRYVKQQMPL